MLKANETKSVARTLKQGIASKKALKEVRRNCLREAIRDGIGAGKDGAPLAKSTWRGVTQTNLLDLFRKIMDTDPDEFTAGWNYNADQNGPLSGSAPFYASVKTGDPVLSGSARAEWIAARQIIDDIASDEDVDYDQAIRQWLELDEAEQFRSKPVQPSKSKTAKYNPIVKMLVDEAAKRGLTIKELTALVKGTIAAMDKVKKAKKAA